jgi:hypothetical protein
MNGIPEAEKLIKKRKARVTARGNGKYYLESGGVFSTMFPKHESSAESLENSLSPSVDRQREYDPLRITKINSTKEAFTPKFPIFKKTAYSGLIWGLLEDNDSSVRQMEHIDPRCHKIFIDDPMKVWKFLYKSLCFICPPDELYKWERYIKVMDDTFEHIMDGIINGTHVSKDEKSHVEAFRTLLKNGCGLVPMERMHENTASITGTSRSRKQDPWFLQQTWTLNRQYSIDILDPEQLNELLPKYFRREVAPDVPGLDLKRDSKTSQFCTTIHDMYWDAVNKGLRPTRTILAPVVAVAVAINAV